VHSPWLLKEVDQVVTGPQALALLNRACAPAIVHHSARTLRYALAINQREDLVVDQPALVHACLLHDLGASALATSVERFEVQGAYLAVQFLQQHEADGWSPSRRQAVWAAIAVHTSPHIAEHMSPLTRLVRLGVRTDFGEDLVDPEVRHAAEQDHPRHDIERVLSGVVVESALQDERRAPKSSWPAGLLAAHRASTDPDARLAAF
jgi:hypothetical protein